MYKLTILFRPPTSEDTARFENDWAFSFVPAAEAMPGVLRVEVGNVEGSPDGPAPFYKMHELYFESREAMEAAMNSELGMKAGYALSGIAKGLFSIMFVDAFEDAPCATSPDMRRKMMITLVDDY